MTDWSDSTGNVLAGSVPPSARPGRLLLTEGLARQVLSGKSFLGSAYWILCVVAVGAAYGLGGIAALTMTLAAAIGLWAVVDAAAALWMTSGFLVFVMIFFQETAPTGDTLPEEFYLWGVGLLIITLGLVTALLFSRQASWKTLNNRLRNSSTKTMALLLVVFLLASGYGLLAGNDYNAVARQLFGCVLLVVYYLLAIAFLRTPEDVERWLQRVTSVVVLGAIWFAGKLLFASLAGGSYYREQSHVVGYAGGIAVVAWNELLRASRATSWLRWAAQFVICAAAILLAGNRAAMGCLLVVAGFSIFMTRKKRLVFLLVLCLLPAGVSLIPYLAGHLLSNQGLPGQIANRFIVSLEEDQSYQGRMEQWRAVLRTVEERPLLGAGMGSDFAFFAPGQRHQWRVAFVDNGWGFLLLKTGLLGIVVFLILLGISLRRALARLDVAGSSRLQVNSLSLLALFLYGVIGLFSGPTFFHFSGSGFLGTVLGGIVVLAELRQRETGSASAAHGIAGGRCIGEKLPARRSPAC